jgi:hypothetical protein
MWIQRPARIALPYLPNPHLRLLDSRQEFNDEGSGSAKPNATSGEKPQESDSITINKLNCRQVECQV